jgi:hypothetical protein
MPVNSLRFLTNSLIGATMALWIWWDVFLAMNGGPTESMIMRDWGKVSTFWPHLWGFLIGHWFFPRQSQWKSGWMWGLAFWGVLLAWDILWAQFVGTRPWYRYEGFWVLVGILSGMYFWGQVDPWSVIP